MHLADEAVLAGRDIVERGDVRLWNDQHMQRRLRVDIFDDHHPLIFVDDLRRDLPVDNPAEQAFAHGRFCTTAVRGMSCRSPRIETSDNAGNSSTSDRTASS